MNIGTVFISHKHADKEIASEVAKFLQNVSGNRVNVFLSSDSQFRSPRAGGNLDDELQQAIQSSGVMILIYTGMSGTLDWSFCMYECGYATSRGIRLIVLQCGDEAPGPLRQKVRIRADDENDVLNLTNDFMTSPHFFENQKSRVTEFPKNSDAVKREARTLHQLLNKAINDLNREGPQEWSCWSSLSIKLEGADCSFIKDGNVSLNDRKNRTFEAMKQRAVIVASKGADRIFGIGIENGMLFQPLVDAWKEAQPNQSFEWYTSLCDQIEICCRKNFPPLKETRIREVMGNSHLIPVVTRTFSYPKDGGIEFEVHFYDVRPRSPIVGQIMVRLEDMYYRTMNGVARSPIREILNEMQKRDRHRLPILDGAKRVRYMVHRSMICEFVAQAALDGKIIEDLRLDDMLNAPEMQEMFERTFVFAPPTGTLEDAREAMLDVKGARDVLVTTDGTKNTEVLGMLTNVDLNLPR